MFECIVALFSYLPNESPLYFVVATYGFDLGLQVGDEIWVYMKVQDKPYNLKTKVVNREKAIYPKDHYSKSKDTSIFQLRIFVEAEDRDAMIEIRERLEWKHEFEG